jgi:hypothetical protein
MPPGPANPHGIGQVGAEFFENAPHPPQQIISFTPQRRAATEAISRRSFHFW